jgi:hypothetical protein
MVTPAGFRRSGNFWNVSENRPTITCTANNGVR